MKNLIFTLIALGHLDPDKSYFNLNKFSDRLFYQKIIFLSSQKMKSLNYSFNWYKRGPYSPDLTKDLYSIKEVISNNSYFNYLINQNDYIKNNISRELDSIKSLKKEFHKLFNREWEATDLEILASLVFINKYTYSECRKSRQNTIQEFFNRKPELKLHQIEKYLVLLERESFVYFE